MAGTLHTAYIPDVADYIKGADKSLNSAYIVRQILRTLRNFCRETWIWREVLPKISVVDGTDSYTLTASTDNSDVVPEVYMVDWVKYKEDGLDDDQLTFLRPWNIETEEVPTATGISANFVETEADAPQVFYIDPDDSLIVKPIPNDVAAGTENMQVKCILMPSLTSTTGPTWIYRDFLETIAKGTASRIAQQAAYKWYDPKVASMYGFDYRKKRDDEAKEQRWGGKNRTQMHVRVHKGFSGGSSQRNWIF
jgi:hypothetical protein